MHGDLSMPREFGSSKIPVEFRAHDNNWPVELGSSNDFAAEVRKGTVDENSLTSPFPSAVAACRPGCS